MEDRSKQIMEFRYYDMPSPEPIIIFHGSGWRRNYGVDAPNLHFHNILEIGICREGYGRMIYEDCEKEYHAGMVSIIPKNLPHNTMNEEGVYSLWDYIFIDEAAYISRMEPNKEFFNKTMERIESRHCLFDQSEYPEFVPLIDCIIREHELQKPYMKETIASLTIATLMVIARINREYDTTKTDDMRKNSRLLNECLKYIDDNYSKDIGVGELAADMHISETGLRDLFRINMNMAPLDYINLIRIRHACEMLQKTSDSIEQISYKCGFSTPSTFNRNFRRYMDQSPSSWRKSYVGKDNIGLGIHIQSLKGWY